jgi:hypothetical protein
VLSAGYSFCVDYGANSAILGSLTTRGLVTASLAAALAYMALPALFSGGGTTRPSGEAGADGATPPQAGQAALLLWLMTAVACWGVYHELGPRLRLPSWGLLAMGLLRLGRRPGWAAAHLRAHGYLLVAATAAEGILSYLVYPESLMGTVGRTEAAIYGGTSLGLLGPLFWRPQPETASEDRATCYGLAALSLALLALFATKEMSGSTITLGWAGLGASFLVSGLAAGRRELRLPGLGLLCLAALKALLLDLTGLALPYRVLSYSVLGGLLVLSSYLYVGWSRTERADGI